MIPILLRGYFNLGSSRQAREDSMIHCSLSAAVCAAIRSSFRLSWELGFSGSPWLTMSIGLAGSGIWTVGNCILAEAVAGLATRIHCCPGGASCWGLGSVFGAALSVAPPLWTVFPMGWGTRGTAGSVSCCRFFLLFHFLELDITGLDCPGAGKNGLGRTWGGA